MGRYDWKRVEAKWQAAWRQAGTARAPERPADPSRKQYVLVMFPYPSGDLHVGHLRNYTIGDVACNYARMRGREVLYPMGWDAFGMPAEQAAIQHGVHPREWTLANIAVSKATLRRLGYLIDWEREVTTCLPDYYRWTQWLFLVMHRQGLTERRRSLVNWCETCHTVLANEQVSTGGCWRCGNPATKKELEQWYFRMSAYADRLLKDIETLAGWPEGTKAMQRHWIGRSEGAEIVFRTKGGDVTVFTTRPDTLFGATYVVLAPEHPLVERIADPARLPGLRAYRQKALLAREIDRASTAREKTGIFTGATALNPATGREVPVWVADYVLTGYGTGAIMAVPAHDRRDFDFAKAQGLPVVEVIRSEGGVGQKAYEGDGVLLNSPPFDGMESARARREITDWLAKQGLARPTVQYRLKDWLVSRQRFWGAPVPMVHCPRCGIVPVPEKDLPVLLPEGVKDFIPKGRSPLADVPAFVRTSCPACKGPAERDVDTLDTFLCSSWYLFRYCDPGNPQRAFRRDRVDAWCPVDLYIGGAEHACMHLLYFRFVTKVLKDAGFLGFEEPVRRLFHQGMVHGANGEVMSKSKGNAVPAGPFIDRVGVDVARLALLFMAPSGDDVRWSEDGVTGAWRFVNRLWEAFEPRAEAVRRDAGRPVPAELPPALRELRRRLHLAVRRSTEAFEGDFAFNTAIAAVMEFLNAFSEAAEALDADPSAGPVLAEAGLAVARLMAPLAPHLAEELWEAFGQAGSVLAAPWPQADPAAIALAEVELALQVNGRLKGHLRVDAKATEATVREIALSHPALSGKTVRRVKVVPGRLVNVVVAEGAVAP